MPLDLTTISFHVDTKELLDAKNALDNLESSVNKLNNAVKEETSTASNASKPLNDITKASNQSASANNTLIRSTSDLDKLIRNLTNTYADMAQGMTKGESATLNRARGMGATVQQLEEVKKALTDIGSLNKNPFDASLGSIRSIEKELEALQQRSELAANGISLSTKQLSEYSKIASEIQAKLKTSGIDTSQGQGLSQYNKLLEESKNKYVELAKQVNSSSSQEKVLQRDLRDRENAVRNVQAAEERLFNTVEHLSTATGTNSRLNERAALAIGSYERNLRLAGISGEEAAAKLAKFKAAQEQVTAAEMKNRGNYIARGIGVQAGDVAVSLASGMNPITVAIQQGDQIRGLLEMAGLSSQQLSSVMRQAFSNIAKSFKDVGTAMGAFVTGSIASMGESVVNLGMKYTGLNSLLKQLEEQFPKTGNSVSSFIQKILTSDIVALSLGGSIAGLIAGLVSLSVAYYKASASNDALTIAINTSGASIGMSAKQLIAYSENHNIAGVSVNKLKESLGTLASENFRYRDSLDLVVKSAQMYSKATGADLNDVMKKYGEVIKDPIKALTELTIATGEVDIKTIEQIDTLLKAGKQYQATKLAVDEYAKAQKRVAEETIASLSPMSSLWRIVKDQASAAWDSISKFATSGVVVDGLKYIGIALVSIYGVAKELAIAFNAVGAMAWNIAGLNFSGAAQNWKNYKEQVLSANKETTSLLSQLNSLNKSSAIPGGNSTSKRMNVDAVEAKKQYDEVAKNYKKQMEDTQAMRVSRAKYITDFIAKETARAGQPLDDKLLAAVKLSAGKEWDSANRAEITAANKEKRKEEAEANKVAREYQGVLTRISELNVKNTGVTENLTKAEQLRLDIIKSPEWEKFGAKQRARIEYELQQAKAIELTTKATEAQRAADKSSSELDSDHSKFLNNLLLEIKAKQDNLAVTEEQKLVNNDMLKIEKEREAELKKISDHVAEMKKNNVSPDIINKYQTTETSKVDARTAETKAIVKKAEEDTYQQMHSFEAGWDTAFTNYSDSAKNAAAIGTKVFQDMTDKMADMVVEFATTGKLSITDFANTFIKEIIRMQAKALASQLFGNSSGVIGGGLGSFIGWLTGTGGSSSALEASIGTYGGAAATTSASDVFSMIGFASGGYTGQGGMNTPAGIVHKGEVVWSQEDIARAGGVGIVEAMRQGVRGYADGGIVGASLPPMAANNTDNSSQVTVNVSVASDGASKVSTDKNTGNQFGSAIAAAVQAEILKQKRNGGLLSGT